MENQSSMETAKKTPVRFITEKWKELLLAAVILGLGAVCILYAKGLLPDGQTVRLTGLIAGEFSKTAFLIVLSVFVVFCCLVLLAVNFFHLTKWWVGLALLGFMTLVFFLILPLSIFPDDSSHFIRAFEISQGSLLSKHLPPTGSGGNILPVGLVYYTDRTALMDWSQTCPIWCSNTSLYSPFNYLPQALGIRIATLFSVRPFTIAYAGKLASILLMLGLDALILKRALFGRNLLFMILLFPMTLQSAVSSSSDGLAIALCCLYLVEVLRIAYKEKTVTTKDLIILAVLAFFISQIKIVYIVVVLAIWIIPKERFQTKFQKLWFRLLIPLLAIVSNLVWLVIASGYLTDFQPGVDSGAQVKLVLKNPVGYLKLLFSNVTQEKVIVEWVAESISLRMGMVNIQTPDFVWMAVLVMIICETVKIRLYLGSVKKWHGLLLLGISLAVFVLVLTSLYVQWTPVGSPTIAGVQGRYFTPIASYLLSGIILLCSARASRTQETVGNDLTKTLLFSPDGAEERRFPVVAAVMVFSNIFVLIKMIPVISGL